MIIGFTGRKGSGKDTAARVLEAKGFTHLKMADGLKVMLRALLAFQGVNEETIERMIEGDLKEQPSSYLAGRSPRYAMQTLGTEWGRDLMDENFWVGCFGRAALVYTDVVCSDVRFPNEVAECDFVYRIERGVAASDEHVSEALIDMLPVAGVIENKVMGEFQEQISRLDHH